MVSVLYIGNNLRQQGRNTTRMSELGPLLEQEGYKVTYASSKANKFLRLFDMLSTCLKNRNQVDHVLIDTYSTLNFWYAFFVSQLCRLLKLNYIPILHGGNLEFRLRNNPLLSRLIFRHAYINIAPSRFIKETFERYGYSNLKYIPNTVTIAHYPFKKREMHEAKLFWVRSFSEIYNPQLAVKVLRALKDQGITASLCMVGPNSGDGSLEVIKQLAKQLQVEVIFTGKLSKQEWIALSNKYNLFINTTNFDNMPVSAIEAMALGLPVVSTNVGGMPHLIEHGTDGMLVAPDDEDEFVAAIKHLISNPGLVDLITLNARQKVESFDWTMVKKRWINVLK